MSMVLDWIQKSLASGEGVTEKSQLKSGLALSLAQTAYQRHVFDRSEFIETHGLNTNATTQLERKTGLKGLFQTNPLINIATACAGLHGCALISIFGSGGHALGYKQRSGVVQFFDPNDGILEFASSVDFATWFPSYIKGEYPDLRDRVHLRKITS